LSSQRHSIPEIHVDKPAEKPQVKLVAGSEHGRNLLEGDRMGVVEGNRVAIFVYGVQEVWQVQVRTLGRASVLLVLVLEWEVDRHRHGDGLLLVLLLLHGLLLGGLDGPLLVLKRCHWRHLSHLSHRCHRGHRDHRLRRLLSGKLMVLMNVFRGESNHVEGRLRVVDHGRSGSPRVLGRGGDGSAGFRAGELVVVVLFQVFH
jgi:hypothetical protein